MMDVEAYYRNQALALIHKFETLETSERRCEKMNEQSEVPDDFYVMTSEGNIFQPVHIDEQVLCHYVDIVGMLDSVLEQMTFGSLAREERLALIDKHLGRIFVAVAARFGVTFVPPVYTPSRNLPGKQQG
jgi:hypothetical protein